MGEPVLAGDFERPDEAQWREAVEKALRGAPFERLVSRTADDIALLPLYTSGPDESHTGAPGSAPFTRGFSDEGRPDGRWDVRSFVDSPDPAAGNDLALRELERGATSLSIAGASLRDESAFTAVLEGVHTDLVGVNLAPGADFLESSPWLMQLWLDTGVVDEGAKGGFGADPMAVLAATGELPQGVDRALADMAGLASMTAGRFPGVRAVTIDATPYGEAGGSEAQELAAMLSTGVAYLRAMQRAGLAAASASAQIELVLGADADVFTTIAKLRAARRVWTAMASACGIDCSTGTPAMVVRSLERMMSRRDPWVNLLRVTAAGFAAVIGGADTLVTLPYDAELGQPTELGRRLARNTQLLLGEESGLGRVLDPAGGSWYVETLTEQLAASAWRLFTELESAGGMPAVLLDGSLADRIAAVRESRFDSVARRSQPITGVSEFPDLGEASPADSSAIAIGGADLAVSPEATRCAPLPRVRWAQPFESLRDAADLAAEAAGGVRPSVFLANLGPVAVHTARAAFARNLFAAGGLAAVSSEMGSHKGFESVEQVAVDFGASGCALACICSSDRLYEEMGTEVAAALKAAGAAYVYLAGDPGDRRGELLAAGVDEFVHVGTDVLVTLRRAHGLLDIPEGVHR